MIGNRCAFPTSPRSCGVGVLGLAVLALGTASPARAQQTGTISGRVTDEQGSPLVGAQVLIAALRKDARSRANGEYVLDAVPAGSHAVQARLIGYRSQSATVSLSAGQRASQNFSLTSDPLHLAAVVVTGTETPRTKLDASSAVTVLSAADITRAAPRSTTEMLRYIPGFTRVESSGGEVNQNYVVRGILGIEYVMFMEDGLPVFPAPHTFWMNGDNLFRPDLNLERVEVVRSGSSSLFTSNTPGAIANFINKTGGPEFDGGLRATAGTDDNGLALARYDVNLNGPLGEDWRFNLGGFYRYDHGVRDPGFPGIRGGQFKASITRLLDRGYVRASVKVIDDRNQFVLPLPFQNPDDPDYLAGFSEFGAYSTREANHTRVQLPTGDLELPLDDGLRTKAYWLTADAEVDLGGGWTFRNTAQVMSDEQGFNAIFPGTPVNANDWVADQIQRLRDAGFTLPATPVWELVYTNHRDDLGNRIDFASETVNGFLSPSEQPHIEKPISAFQNQLRVTKSVGRHTFSTGFYFANYTQTNRWFIPLLLMDVRDQPRLVDLIVLDINDDTIEVTKNGYRSFLDTFRDGFGQTTIFSASIGAELQLTDRLRADLGLRYEFNDFVQSSANTERIDLDEDTLTRYDRNMQWRDGTVTHVAHTMDDVAGSVGLNYSLTDEVSLYAQGSRAYSLPELDEFLALDPRAIELFEAQQVLSGEVGVRYASGPYAFTLTGFYARLENITGQGLVVDPITGGTTWIVTTSPDTRSYGVEVEGSARLAGGLGVIANATILNGELGSGTDIGSRLNQVPPVIGNLALTYTPPGTSVTLLGDWHYVAKRFAVGEATSSVTLPAYSYFNYGVSFAVPGTELRVSANLLNAFQSKGLEEGDPRALLAGPGAGVFSARPLLPRRLTVSLEYDL